MKINITPDIEQQIKFLLNGEEIASYEMIPIDEAGRRTTYSFDVSGNVEELIKEHPRKAHFLTVYLVRNGEEIQINAETYFPEQTWIEKLKESVRVTLTRLVSRI